MAAVYPVDRIGLPKDHGAAMALSGALRDPRGHLTVEGLAALAAAPAGRAPSDLANHVASCVQCQERVLAGGLVGARRDRRPPPPAWRIWAVLAAILLTLVSILVVLQKVR
jgi:hypothetical protein